jgi:hypothetical protein
MLLEHPAARHIAVRFKKIGRSRNICKKNGYSLYHISNIPSSTGNRSGDFSRRPVTYKESVALLPSSLSAKNFNGYRDGEKIAVRHGLHHMKGLEIHRL